LVQLTASARRASHSEAMAVLARFGLAARAFVYVVIGWLAVQIARGRGARQANQRGALADVAQHQYGVALLWVLGVGFAAYAVWRLSEAWLGTAVAGAKAGPRAQSLVRGIVYVTLAVSTFAFIAGVSQPGQSQQQVSLTARAMRHPDGRWLVAAIGLIVVLVGLVMIVQGALRKFQKQLRMQDLSATTRAVVVRLGVVGTIARGVVFAVAGALTVQAAVTFNPRTSTGLDGALRTLADRPYGPWLLWAVALGLIAFGLFGFAEARWAKTTPGEGSHAV